MRLRKKPWIDEAILEFKDFTHADHEQIAAMGKGNWRNSFGNANPLHVELGTGKGRFVSQMAQQNPDINFIGIEAQQDVAYYAALKVKELGLTNVKILVFDINKIEDIFAPREVSRFYINFCDPWPKARHAKRRLTHISFLAKYRGLLQPDGQLFFKTDNRPLFDFSLEQFAEAGLTIGQLSFDLHQSDFAGNVMTEYEEKFSRLGEKINRCEVSFS